jgi:hypothetical protein
MNSHVIAFALVTHTLVRALPSFPIEPNWKKLTDFSTSTTFDLASVITAANAHTAPQEPAFPIKSESGSGTIQLDVLGERFKMTSAAQGEYAQSSLLPPPLQGAKVSGAGSIAFDAKAGFVVYKAKGSVTSTFGPASFELCAKVNFPQGLLPPGQAIMAQLDQVKPQIVAELHNIPHQDVPVDGIDVALFEQKGRPDIFVGVTHEAIPVGFGLERPWGGKWDSRVLKFSDWTTGAGTIEEESCVTMSATELLQSHHANRTLWVFDQLMNQLKSTEPLSSVLAFIPAQPSQIFASAAKLESVKVGAASFNEDAKVPSSSPSAWVTMAMAAVGGVVGAGFVLVLSKSSRASARDYALLA